MPVATRTQSAQMNREGPTTRSKAALLAKFTVDEMEAVKALLELKNACCNNNKTDKTSEKVNDQTRPRRSCARY